MRKTAQMTVELTKAEEHKVGVCFREKVSDEPSCDRYGAKKAYVGIFDNKPTTQTFFGDNGGD